MLDGQIKVWILQDPVRNQRPFRILEGHEDRVTCLDAVEDSLVSASMDRSIRVWCISTGGMLRVLRNSGAPLLQVKLAGSRLISLSASGRVNFWAWNGPLSIELMHHTFLEPDRLASSVDVVLDDVYIAVVSHSCELLAIYSSLNGRRLWEKEIVCSNSHVIHAFALRRGLAALGSGDAVEAGVYILEKTYPPPLEEGTQGRDK
jgi:WD40 repeat protein